MSELRRSSRNRPAEPAESSAPAPAAKKAPPKRTRKGAKGNYELAAAGPVAAESAPTAEKTSSSAEVSTPATRGSNAKGKGKAVEGAGGGAGKVDGADAMDVDPTEPMELDDFAREALTRIEKKLEGLFCPYVDDKALEAMGSTVERVVPTNSLVDMLIREASSKLNLVCRIPSCSNASGPLTRIVRE